jgi:ATPase subunit of ABC transporter with duplicated ATPase domains
MTVLIELTDVSFKTPSGRAIFEGLNLCAGDEHVALVGRNGVGKSTLLSILAGQLQATSGVVERRGQLHYVPQIDDAGQRLSRGQQRKQALESARASGAEILLLDEPTLHLDDAAVAWLRAWLPQRRGCVLVASHDRRLLVDMRHFLVLSETGGHYFGGSLAELERHLEQEHQAQERRYLRNLRRLAAQEAHSEHAARRRDRKKRRGRTSEIDRATPRIRLNQKRSQAQVYQGRIAQIREARLAALRGWTLATRRALNVDLDLELQVPTLPLTPRPGLLLLDAVSSRVDHRQLFQDLTLDVTSERVAVVGPNGSGKTTLLEVMLGKRKPDRGSVRSDPSRIAAIEQGGANWLLDESLLAHLLDLGLSPEDAARILMSHRFPLALAERSLRSLSAGERARAALIAIFSRSPSPELLILDEPTFSLDLVGLRALTGALKRWPGALIVASHDREFLAELGMDRTVELGT